jgi:hypothetical protein
VTYEVDVVSEVIAGTEKVREGRKSTMLREVRYIE